jgi:hypothetical protein
LCNQRQDRKSSDLCAVTQRHKPHEPRIDLLLLGLSPPLLALLAENNYY